MYILDCQPQGYTECISINAITVKRINYVDYTPVYFEPQKMGPDKLHKYHIVPDQCK